MCIDPFGLEDEFLSCRPLQFRRLRSQTVRIVISDAGVRLYLMRWYANLSSRLGALHPPSEMVPVTAKRPDPTDKHVGSRVRMRRLMIGVSQEELGDALGLTFQQVQKYEKGTNRISASRLQQIANVLKVPIPFFFEGAPDFQSSQEAPVDGMSPAVVSDFLSSKDGLILCGAFMQITDVKLRRAIVHLVSSIVDK